MKRVLLALAALGALSGCLAAEETARLAWDRRTLRLIEPGGTYGRMTRLGDGSLVFACEKQGALQARRSTDAGRTWSDAQPVASWADGALANPELLALRDGSLLCFHNRRPRQPARAPYAIAVSRLEPGAAAWSPPCVIYEAGAEFGNGCWEPSAVQLPSGGLLLFFANEAPYRSSGEQEISLMRSADGGRAWSRAERIGFRAGHRDGMPVALALAGGAGVVVAIEDNGLGGAFKPAILFSPLDDLWRSGAVTGESARRWSALAEPLPAAVYAGAPYLRQLPSGPTLLAFQRSGSGDIRQSRIAVCLGDSRARHFGAPSSPFPETPGAPQLWAGLCVQDARTVTLLATATINGRHGVWSIDGQAAPPAVP